MMPGARTRGVVSDWCDFKVGKVTLPISRASRSFSYSGRARFASRASGVAGNEDRVFRRS